MNKTLTKFETTGSSRTVMKVRHLLLLSAIIAMPTVLIGGQCGGPDPNLPPSGSDMLRTNMTAVTIETPAGYPNPQSSLNVQTSIGRSPVADNGAANLRIYDDGPQLATVHDANNDIILMGWIEPAAGRTNINARTTADALAYFDSGGWMTPPEVRVQLVSAIAAETAVETLATEVANALVNPPHTLEGAADALAPVRSQLRTALTKPLDPTSALIIDPAGAKSGIELSQPGLNQLVITNNFRRRAVAFIDRVDPAGQFKRVNLEPTLGTTSLFGTITDLGVRFLYDASKTAYAGVSSDPVELPLDPSDAQMTEYKVTVVGAGLSAGVEAMLTPAQDDVKRTTIQKTLIIDFLVPFFASAVVPLKGSSIDARFGFDDANSIVGTFINTIGNTAPKVWEKAYAGDMRGALTEALDAIRTDGTVRTALIKMLYEIVLTFGTIEDADQFGNRLNKFFAVSGLADSFLTIFDTTVQAGQILSSARAESWTVTVNRSKVVLRPILADIAKGEKATFTATVPEASDGNQLITYKWSTTGAHGTLRDSRGHSGASFDSSVNAVEYTASMTSFGEDTVTVEAILNRGAGMGDTSLGTATSKVIVRDLKPTITPRRTSLGRGDIEIFHARIPEQLTQEGDVLSYIWTTTGQFGGFRSGLNGVEIEEDVVAWLCHSGEEGSDTVAVQVFATREGVKMPLGTASAEILVEQGRKTIVFGTTEFRTEPQPNNRVCCGMHMIIPKVEGGTLYRIYAYNFHDPLFFGRETSDTIDPENVRTHDGGGRATPQVDEGGAWSIGLSGGCGPAENNGCASFPPRFAGMIIEVTVTYD